METERVVYIIPGYYAPPQKRKPLSTKKLEYRQKCREYEEIRHRVLQAQQKLTRIEVEILISQESGGPELLEYFKQKAT